MTPRAVHAAYYVAHAAKSLLWTASDLTTIYALVNLRGVDPDAAGSLFMIGLVANAGADWLVGRWLDHRPSHAPRLAAVALVVSALTFPATILAASLGWSALLAATLIFRISYAAYDVPHNALLSRLAGTPVVATRLARGRTLGTGAAAALVGFGLWQAEGAVSLPSLLWVLSATAMLGGMALIPLLARFSIAPVVGAAADGAGLPWRFLAGSVIGIVALGALGKAILHLPAGIPHPGAGMVMIWLTVGRTAAALMPVDVAGPTRGQWLLGCLYAGGAVAIAPLLWVGGASLPLLLGILLGITNLVGWALLPLLAAGPRGFGLYTMASKLALGTAGLVMTVALGHRPAFADAGLTALAAGSVAMCVLAAALLARRSGLTIRPRQGAAAG